jgi:hypothetical protein
MHTTETPKAATARCSDGPQKLSCLAADEITNNPILAPEQVRHARSDFVKATMRADLALWGPLRVEALALSGAAGLIQNSRSGYALKKSVMDIGCFFHFYCQRRFRLVGDLILVFRDLSTVIFVATLRTERSPYVHDLANRTLSLRLVPVSHRYLFLC